MGYDTSHIKDMINNNLKYSDSNKEVTNSIKAIEKELKELGGFDKSLTSLDEKARKLGITFQKSFQNLKDTGNLTCFNFTIIFFTRKNKSIKNTRKCQK